MTNRMVLSGTIVKDPIRSTSPTGVSHCRFWLEHRSITVEAGLPRHIYCRMAVVISGNIDANNQGMLLESTQELVLGSSIKVSGFIAYHTGRNGIGKLVLHAETIIKI